MQRVSKSFVVAFLVGASVTSSPLLAFANTPGISATGNFHQGSQIIIILTSGASDPSMGTDIIVWDPNATPNLSLCTESINGGKNGNYWELQDASNSTVGYNLPPGSYITAIPFGGMPHMDSFQISAANFVNGSVLLTGTTLPAGPTPEPSEEFYHWKDLSNGTAAFDNTQVPGMYTVSSCGTESSGQFFGTTSFNIVPTAVPDFPASILVLTIAVLSVVLISRIKYFLKSPSSK